jgi:hypothetical protein
MTVGQLIEALGEYNRTLYVHVEIDRSIIPVLSVARYTNLPSLTLEIDQDEVQCVLEDYLEAHLPENTLL